jgi:flagellar hook-basal body complex protein FliE
MINGANNLTGLGNVSGAISTAGKAAGPATAGGSKFAEMLKSSIDEVARLQQDASTAVENLATGRSEDVSGVMTAVEKADLAFKTLLAIRSKLMDAYEEIKAIQV